MSAGFVMTLNKHISDEMFDRYGARQATPAETIFVQTHSNICENCRTKLARIISPEKAFAAVHNSFAFDDLTDTPEHLPYEQLEFFIDHKLDEVDREIATSHLAICGECNKDLADLQIYRQIAADAPIIENKSVESEKQSFWKRLFAFDSVGSFASIAAILLVVALFGAWFLLRGNRGGEIVQVNNQNTVPSNINPITNSLVSSPAPEVLPAPKVSPSPTEIVPNNETIYALNDGQLTVDNKGNIGGLENLSPAAQNLIKQSLQSGKILVTANSLGGGGGALMSEGSADSGVPFALETPIGKIIKENQPILRWKPLKNAANYSVAIVDDKFRVVEQSGNLTATTWKPTKNLPRGANYSWQVTATLADGRETVSPASPAPQARFRVIEQNLFDEINRLEKSGKSSHLALGVLYAKAGLKQEARSEFEKLVRENPNSKLARQLLQSVK